MIGFIHDIVSGMQHLAQLRIVHRDLSARNILVDENHVCKMSHFGPASDVSEDCEY